MTKRVRFHKQRVPRQTPLPRLATMIASAVKRQFGDGPTAYRDAAAFLGLRTPGTVRHWAENEYPPGMHHWPKVAEFLEMGAEGGALYRLVVEAKESIINEEVAKQAVREERRRARIRWLAKRRLRRFYTRERAERAHAAAEARRARLCGGLRKRMARTHPECFAPGPGSDGVAPSAERDPVAGAGGTGVDQVE